jgi:hypothetical protein
MIGYVKCPKCHAPMPAVERARRASVAGGGTTSQRIDVIEGGGAGVWVWVGALVLIGVAVLVWATQFRGRGRAATPGVAPIEAGGTGSGSQVVVPVQPDDLTTPSDPTTPDPAYAADALEAELAGERLYATVDVAGDRLEVRSAFCGEQRLVDVVMRHAAEMRASGVTQVKCSEAHGALVFERGL